jgi:hypothetical protein
MAHIVPPNPELLPPPLPVTHKPSVRLHSTNTELQSLQIAYSQRAPLPPDQASGDPGEIGTISPAVAPADYVAVVIAGQPFTLTLTVQRLDGSTATDFTGTVHWTTDDQTFDPDYPVVLPPDYTFKTTDQGQHDFTFTLRTVSGTGNSRMLTVSDGLNFITSSFNVLMAFEVKATKEGKVGKQTACQHIVKSRDHFASLPAHHLCKRQIVLAYKQRGITTLIRDVGPIYGSNSRGDDPYWNTRGVPLAEIQGLETLAGIDLADGTFSDPPPKGLNLPDNVRILWTFA